MSRTVIGAVVAVVIAALTAIAFFVTSTSFEDKIRKDAEAQLRRSYQVVQQLTQLQAIDVAGAPHDCLEIHYAGDAKLFLPVENIELLSRYGSEDSNVQLDKLGGAGWPVPTGPG